MGICFCASLYAAAVRKPREYSAMGSPCRVERRACMAVMVALIAEEMRVVVSVGAVRVAVERARVVALQARVRATTAQRRRLHVPLYDTGSRDNS